MIYDLEERIARIERLKTELPDLREKALSALEQGDLNGCLEQAYKAIHLIPKDVLEQNFVIDYNGQDMEQFELSWEHIAAQLISTDVSELEDRGIDELSESALDEEQFRTAVVGVLEKSVSVVAEINRQTAEEHKEQISLVVENIFLGNIRQALSGIEEIYSQTTDMPQLKYLGGEIIERCGQENLANNIFLQAASDPKKNFMPQSSRLAISRNQVITYQGPFMHAQTIVEKTYSDELSCLREFWTSMIFKDLLGEGVQVPVFYYNKTAFYKHAGQRTLADLLQDKKDETTVAKLIKAAKVLARVHHTTQIWTDITKRPYEQSLNMGNLRWYTATMLEKIGKEKARKAISVDYAVQRDDSYFTNKIRQTLFLYGQDDPRLIVPQRAQELILHGYSIVNQRLKKIRKAYYKDHNPRNIMFNRGGEMILIDWESCKLLPYLIDLVSLTEFDPGLLSEEQIQEIFLEYAREDESLRTEIPRNKLDEFTETNEGLNGGKKLDTVLYEKIDRQEYLYSRVHRHLEFLGYRTRDFLAMNPDDAMFEEARRRDGHLTTVIDILDKLRSTEEEREYDQLTQVYNGVSMIQELNLKVNGH